MTKWNPDYHRPQMWVLGSVGDTFAEFNCGGIGIVCGVNPKNPASVLGYRPCVGMVGGKMKEVVADGAEPESTPPAATEPAAGKVDQPAE